MSDAILRIVNTVAERLSCPGDVRSTVTTAENVALLANGAPRPAWESLSLDEGYPGISLLFAEMGRTDRRAHDIAHGYLAAAVPDAQAATATVGGIYHGLAALAFAANVAGRRGGGYQKLLHRLDETIVARAALLLEREQARLDAGEAGVPLAMYDVISGLTGVGRYLLDRPAEHRPVVTAIGDYLVRLSVPVTAYGHRVPGWWSPGGANLDTRRHPPRGHFNLGMAHGIAGPLALLSLMSRAGVPVSGADEAAHRIGEWFVSWTARDELGPHWPAVITYDEYLQGSVKLDRPVRPSWCYGTPGIARALQLAAHAFGQPVWERTALEAMQATLVRPATQALLAEHAGVCHGIGGLVQITSQMARDSENPDLRGALPGLTDKLVALFDPETPFGYGLRLHDGSLAPRAGFLEGAAGSALALLDRAGGHVGAGHWDSALLIN